MRAGRLQRLMVLIAVTLSVSVVSQVNASSAAAEVSSDAGDQFSASGQTHELQPFPLEATQQLDHHFGENLKPNTVFDIDDRVLLSPAEPTVALIVMWDSAGNPFSTCTATFIGQRVLLTAAHCLFNAEYSELWAEGVSVHPGIDGESEPYGHEFADNLWVPQGWYEGELNGQTAWESDYAIITLPTTTLGDAVGSVEIASLSATTLSSADFWPVTIGYPGDKPFGTQWSTTQASFKQVEDAFLLHYLDAYPGQSGSGVFRQSDGKLVGVMSAEHPEFNISNRVRPTMIQDLLGACAELGCSFAYSEEQIAPTVDPYTRTWQRPDLPVAAGAASRTWMWGPEAISAPMPEQYAESPNQQRTVVYYDKSRMEITDPNAIDDGLWYVTNGLLVKELITGEMQTGAGSFEARQPAQVNVAGDPGTGPTYASLNSLRALPPTAEEAFISQRLQADGSVILDPNLASRGIAGGYFVSQTNHTVAQPFWDFMNSTDTVFEDDAFVIDALFINPFYATGYPITEAYWTEVKVGGTPKDVLIQCFERRCLTYTPDNPAGWQVEAGNVGRHYYEWRYGQTP